MQRRLFTLDEANRLIPWLERAFQGAMETYERLQELRQRLTEIQRERMRRNGTFDRQAELSATETRVQEIEADINEILRDISAEGIIVRDVSRGLVDFPSVRDGREVYLCWVRGEDTIGFWHDTNRGFDHRQPL